MVAVSAAAAVIVLALTGCGGAAEAGNEPDGAEQVKTVRYQGSPNNVSLAELTQDLGFLEDVKLEWVSNTTSGPQNIQSVATNQTDIGGAFTGAPVQAVINYYGEDEKTFTGYYVLEGSPIRTARDLIGKKIAVNTLRALFTDVGVIGGPFDAGQYVIRKDFLAANPDTSRKLVTGVASPGGRIKDQDFTRWSEYLTSAGVIKGGLDLPKLYTNDFNGLAPASTTKG